MEDEPVNGFEDVTPDASAQTDVATAEPTATDQTETQTDQSTDTEVTTPDDDDLAWAQKKGVNLDDKAAVAKMLRNSDRKVSEADVKVKTSLQQAVDNTEPAFTGDVVTDLQNKYHVLETKFTAQQYYLDNPDDKAYDAEAVAILTEKSADDPEFARALGRNLPELFRLARSRHSEEEVAKAKDEGRKEERRSLAGKQRASATSQAATTSSPVEEDDPFLKGFMSG